MKDLFVLRKELDPETPWHVKLELSKPELQAIGHVVAQWAITEYLMREHSLFLVECLGDTAPDTIDSDSFRKRKRAWESLARLALAQHPEQLDEALNVIQRTGSIQHERHNLIHGLIKWDPSNRNRLQVHSHKLPKQRPWKVDKHKIETIALKIAALNYDILALHDGPDIVSGAASRRKSGKPIRINLPQSDLGPLLSNLARQKPPQ